MSNVLTHDRYSATSLLASRELSGYPGCNIALHVEGRDYTVLISDPVCLTEWKPVTRKEAKDMYFHPFVYGYKVPDLSIGGEDDGA